jgi:hypothetical protein
MIGNIEQNYRLAILVPYRNRERYLRIFLSEVPKYLERVNGVTDYAIYVAEQQSPDLFNLALSRNVAALVALDDEAFTHFVFHDVDVIPLHHIDYRPRSFNVAWFLSAGSCQIKTEDFVKANGYNPGFAGWGDEDVEFYHRLSHLGSDLREWHRTPESREAVVMNLEWPDLADNEALAWSRRYFGHETSGPRFVPYRCSVSNGNLQRYDKSKDFWEVGQQQRNNTLWNQIYMLPPAEKTSYFAQNGLSRVRINHVTRITRGRVRWIEYRIPDVLKLNG